MDLTEAGVPEVPALGRTRYTHAFNSSAPHQHKGCLEIGLCLRGILALSNENGEHRIMPNDLFINQPTDRHHLTSHPKGTMINWLLVREPRRDHPFLRLSRDEVSYLWGRLRTLPNHIDCHTAAVKQDFAQLFRTLELPKTHFRTMALTATCTMLLLHVIEAAEHKSASPSQPRLEQIIAAIRAHPERRVRLDDLAYEARLSPSVLITRFKRLTGLPPHHFQMACRLEKGKQLLRETDKSITEIAHELGFCASQHFSGHFKRAFGLTPSQWRKRR